MHGNDFICSTPLSTKKNQRIKSPDNEHTLRQLNYTNGKIEQLEYELKQCMKVKERLENTLRYSMPFQPIKKDCNFNPPSFEVFSSDYSSIEKTRFRLSSECDNFPHLRSISSIKSSHKDVDYRKMFLDGMITDEIVNMFSESSHNQINQKSKISLNKSKKAANSIDLEKLNQLTFNDSINSSDSVHNISSIHSDDLEDFQPAPLIDRASSVGSHENEKVLNWLRNIEKSRELTADQIDYEASSVFSIEDSNNNVTKKWDLPIDLVTSGILSGPHDYATVEKSRKSLDTNVAQDGSIVFDHGDFISTCALTRANKERVLAEFHRSKVSCGELDDELTRVTGLVCRKQELIDEYRRMNSNSIDISRQLGRTIKEDSSDSELQIDRIDPNNNPRIKSLDENQMSATDCQSINEDDNLTNVTAIDEANLQLPTTNSPIQDHLNVLTNSEIGQLLLENEQLRQLINEYRSHSSPPVALICQLEQQVRRNRHELKDLTRLMKQIIVQRDHHIHRLRNIIVGQSSILVDMDGRVQNSSNQRSI